MTHATQKSPLEKGAKGVVKKTQPPEYPFVKGDLKGLKIFIVLR